MREAWAAMKAGRTLWLAIVGLTWFWAMASLLGQDMLVYARSVLHYVDGLLLSAPLGRPGLSGKVLQDGWYETGDIVRKDADGFLHITDRLSRFSKIPGILALRKVNQKELVSFRK